MRAGVWFAEGWKCSLWLIDLSVSICVVVHDNATIATALLRVHVVTINVTAHCLSYQIHTQTCIHSHTGTHTLTLTLTHTHTHPAAVQFDSQGWGLLNTRACLEDFLNCSVLPLESMYFQKPCFRCHRNNLNKPISSSSLTLGERLVVCHCCGLTFEQSKSDVWVLWRWLKDSFKGLSVWHWKA